MYLSVLAIALSSASSRSFSIKFSFGLLSYLTVSSISSRFSLISPCNSSTSSLISAISSSRLFFFSNLRLSFLYCFNFSSNLCSCLSSSSIFTILKASENEKIMVRSTSSKSRTATNANGPYTPMFRISTMPISWNAKFPTCDTEATRP